MNLKKALIYALKGKPIRRKAWAKDSCVRIVTGLTAFGGRLRIVHTDSTNIPVYEALERLDADATDWEIYMSAPVETKSEDKPFRDMSDNELLTWTGSLTRRLAHEFAVRRPSPKFDSLKYCLRVASHICNL